MSQPNALEIALRQRRVLVCVGSGGVGKTTVAATLGLRAAAMGRRVLVLTIDPAKRLADALGLVELGNVERQVDTAPLCREGMEVEGELWAMMLDLKRSWDDFIVRSLPEEKQEAVLRNRFYRTLSSALAGSQEYIATEKLYELYLKGGYDLLILDTPPTANALDFLDAPRRILDFLDSETLRFLLTPGKAVGRIGLHLFRLGGGLVAKALARLTGEDTLRELASFMLQLEGTYEHFKDRAAKVKELLTSPEAAFVLVTSPQALPVDEAIYFHGLLVDEGIDVAAVVSNRVERDPLPDRELPTAETLANRLAERGIEDAADLGARLVETFEEQRIQARSDASQRAKLRAATRPTLQIAVPRFTSDVYDLPSLWRVGSHLLPDER